MRETPAALEAFERYWAMGPTRSLEKLAEADIQDGFGGDSVDARNRTLCEWSRQHNWQDRLKERIEAEAAEFRDEMRERAAAFRKRVLGGIEVDISRYISRLQNAQGEVLAENAAALERMVKLYMQLAEQPLGERMEIMGKGGGPVEVNHTGNVIAKLAADEQTAQLLGELSERIAGIAGAPPVAGGADALDDGRQDVAAPAPSAPEP